MVSLSDFDNEQGINHMQFYGQHDEKLKNLEKMQTKISEDITSLKTEIKEDIKELGRVVKENTSLEIKAIEVSNDLQLEALKSRVDRIESVLFWAALGIISSAALFIWTRVTTIT